MSFRSSGSGPQAGCRLKRCASRLASETLYHRHSYYDKVASLAHIAEFASGDLEAG